MFKNLWFFFALLGSLTLNAQDGSKSTIQFLERLDQKIPNILEEFSIPGTAIAIIDNGEIVLQKGYGYADIEKGLKVSTQTGFNIASISKTVAAWGVMKLVQEGKIGLDMPAEKYLTRWHLPESEFNSNEVTIRRLLSHTAGLSLHGYPGWTPKDTLPTIEESLNGKTNGAGSVEIVMKPGTQYQYSGGGYTILQLIVEEVTGQKFEDYMQEQILNPLGMTNSSFKIDDKIMAASASEYDNFGEKTSFELFTAQAAAGLHTTIEDFTRFAFANFYQHESSKKYKPVLSASTLQQMMESAPSYNEDYGLGYERDTRKIMEGLRGHSGGNTGWQSFFRVDPTTKDGIIMFTNGGAGYHIVNAVYCEWFGWNKGETLWEGCGLQPSIANKLKQIIDKEGIEGIATTYSTLKKEQSDKYNFAENQLNNLGYFYMGRKEYENAIAIFKLNVEAFPDAYNVYDSYAEALLANGFREEAIKNYKRSIKLFPGNGHGIGVLKELGITTEDLIEHISVAVDTRVLAGYVGSYQTSTGETVTIEINQGQLTSDLQEQKLSLVAQSPARFITLGEGTIVTFFTSATGQKGLWARQKIWKKRPNALTEGSEQKDAIVAPQQVLSGGNFLVFRNQSSWGRITDFENVLVEIGSQHEQKGSNSMSETDLSAYDVIIVSGGQDSVFYKDYVDNIKRFDDYVEKGGTLLLELNWAERNKSFTLPRGVTLAKHPALENAIIQPKHPIFIPLSGKSRIWARHSSSSYLQNIPDEAQILVVETNGKDILEDRPTFIEYPSGKGYVIAASQCFHDRDGSGRGPLMESVISYALTKSRTAIK